MKQVVHLPMGELVRVKVDYRSLASLWQRRRMKEALTG
jgi:hypothetical protein